MKNFVICLSVISSSLLFVDADIPYLTEQPSYLPSCQIKDPEFTKCSTNSIQALFTQVNIGLPGLESLKLDPLTINKIKINQSGSEAVSINVELSKVVVRGFGKLKIVESRVSPKDYSWQTKIFLSNMKIDSNYAVKGRILVINLNSHGKMSLDLDNVNMRIHTKTRLYEKGGFTFYNVTDLKVEYILTGLKSHLDNLFNGNKELEDSTNLFFNENWQTLNDALKPVIQKTIADIVQDTLRTLFHFIPANFFVTDIPTSKELYGE